MKLQKQLSRKIGKKEYPKWVVTIPPEDIERLGWEEGQSLGSAVSSEGLSIFKSDELTYEDFKNKVLDLLTRKRKGLTWQEIKNALNLSQTVPNNKWVRRLEKEISLKRRKEGTATYWYLPHENDTVVFTIGYEGRDLGDFIGILKLHGIEQLIDVRELAFSRRNGFAKSKLSKALRQNGIVYKHFPALGSPKAIRYKLWREGNYNDFFKEYTEALSRPESQEYFKDLEGLAQVRSTVIMCFERDVTKCHRSIIKERLIRDGFRVVDI